MISVTPEFSQTGYSIAVTLSTHPDPNERDLDLHVGIYPYDVCGEVLEMDSLDKDGYIYGYTPDLIGGFHSD